MEQKGISSNSSLLNLALSSELGYGWRLGRISNVVGDKSSGKTLLAIEAMIALLRCKEFKHKKAIYYETEAAFDFEYAKMLGMPETGVEKMQGETIEHFFDTLLAFCKEAKKKKGAYLFILDSLDGLSSDDESKKDISEGSYNMSKQKKLGELFRRLVSVIEEANVHLMIISQVRQNIGALPFAPKHIRSGGKALDFYASQILWLSERAKLKNKKTGLVYGMEILGKVTKNKITLPFREANFQIIFNYGLDDLGSVVDWIIKTDESNPVLQKLSGGYYKLAGFGDKMKRDALISLLEKNGYGALQQEVKKIWRKREIETLPDRQRRFE